MVVVMHVVVLMLSLMVIKVHFGAWNVWLCVLMRPLLYIKAVLMLKGGLFLDIERDVL